MSGSDAVFLAVSFVLIIAWTAYNIWTMRRRHRLYREIQKLIDQQKKPDEEPK